MAGQKIYIATVALERNRWGSKEPSFNVSEWIERFVSDGFDGVELWENHFQSADSAEKERLAAAAPLAIYNSYVGLDDESGEARASAAEAIRRLQAGGVKYNFGHDPEKTDEYRRNLCAWQKELPADCTLLCECHGGTVLEKVEVAESVFADLDPDKFGIIIHISNTPGSVEPWFEAFGDRIKHGHGQLADPARDPTQSGGAQARRTSV